MEKRRTDLIGRTGTLTTSVEVVDAMQSEHGIDIRVKDGIGETYWTNLDEVELDD